MGEFQEPASHVSHPKICWKALSNHQKSDTQKTNSETVTAKNLATYINTNHTGL
jgi:hypothetical protein